MLTETKLHEYAFHGCLVEHWRKVDSDRDVLENVFSVKQKDGTPVGEAARYLIDAIHIAEQHEKGLLESAPPVEEPAPEPAPEPVAEAPVPEPVAEEPAPSVELVPEPASTPPSK